MAYGLHDYLVLPTLYATAWKIRYGVFLPVATLVLALLGRVDLGRWHQPLGLFFGTTACAVVLWIGALAPGHGRYLYTSYAPLFVIMGPFLVRLNVVTELAYTALTAALYLGFDGALSHSDATLRLSICTTLVTMGGIGALVARQQERQARQSFLQRRTIAGQIAALDREKQRSPEELLLNVLLPAIAERLKERAALPSPTDSRK